MAAAQNDELISVRRSDLEECCQDLVNLKACFKMLVKERAKSILEEKAEKAEKEEKAAEHLLDGVNALKRKFETMVNGHDRVMLPDDEGPGLQTDSEESETDEEGPGYKLTPTMTVKHSAAVCIRSLSGWDHIVWSYGNPGRKEQVTWKEHVSV
jgi:hypothetical protein